MTWYPDQKDFDFYFTHNIDCPVNESGLCGIRRMSPTGEQCNPQDCPALYWLRKASDENFIPAKLG